MKRLYVSYSVEGFFGKNKELDDKIIKFFESIGFECLGSGSGGGYRDIDFEEKEKHYDSN